MERNEESKTSSSGAGEKQEAHEESAQSVSPPGVALQEHSSSKTSVEPNRQPDPQGRSEASSGLSASVTESSGTSVQGSTDAASVSPIGADPRKVGTSSTLSSRDAPGPTSKQLKLSNQPLLKATVEEDKDGGAECQDKDKPKSSGPVEPPEDGASKSSAQVLDESSGTVAPEQLGASAQPVGSEFPKTSAESQRSPPNQEKSQELSHPTPQETATSSSNSTLPNGEKSENEPQEKLSSTGNLASDEVPCGERSSPPCEVPVEGGSTTALEAPSIKGQPGVLLSGLVELYKTGMLTDVVLKAGGVRVPCHRAVLAASSPYFRAMFTAQTVERVKEEITLWELSGPALRQVVDFMYTGKMDISNKNIERLIGAANHLQLEGLLASCEEHMTSQLCIDNCVEIYVFADLYSLEKLKSLAFDFLAENFSEVSRRPEFLCLDQNALRSLLSSDKLEVDREEEVFEALVTWLRHDPEGRGKAVVALFREVRLALLDVEYLTDTVAKCDVIASQPFCRSLIAEARLYSISKSYVMEEGEGLDINTRLRHGMYRQPVLIFTGGTHSPDQRAFACFDPATKKNYVSVPHHQSFDFKYKVDLYRLVVTPTNDIYFIGGILHESSHLQQNSPALADVLRYVQKERHWVPCPPMQEGRCGFTVSCHGNQILVFGGKDSLPDSKPLASGESFNTKEEKWRSLSPMPDGLGRWHHMAVVLEDSLYILGGKAAGTEFEEEEEFLESILQYTIPTDSWIRLNSRLPRPRAEGLALAHDGRIYILGGCSPMTDLAEMDIWLPERDRFRVGPPFPDLRKVLSAAILGGSIYVCGGILTLPARTGSCRRTRVVEMRDLFRYDLDQGAWSKEVSSVEFGVHSEMAMASINLRYMDESNFVSHLKE